MRVCIWECHRRSNDSVGTYAVLDRLRTHPFFCKLSKCAFLKPELKYLGHVLSRDGLKVDPDKVAVVQGWPVPDSVSTVRSFLGMCNYFRWFIQGYAKLCTPLSSLLKKDAPFAWSAACAEAFQGLKYALTHAPVLVLPDFSTDAPTFEVWCDASGFAVGAVLMQGGRPVVFEARTMTHAERNYTVGKHELLAVVYIMLSPSGADIWRE